MKHATLEAVQETELREPDLYDKTVWLCGEFMELSRRLAASTAQLETARSQHSLVGMRRQYFEIETIRDQISHLHKSLERGIANEMDRKEVS